MRKAIAATVFTGILVAGAATWAFVPRHGGRFGQWDARHQGPLQMLVQGEIGRLMTLRSDLDISNEQREEIRTIVTGYREDFAPLVREMVWQRQVLRNAVLAESANTTDIKQQVTALGETIAEVSLLAADVIRDVRPVLTPDQIERVETFTAEHDTAAQRWLERHGEYTPDAE